MSSLLGQSFKKEAVDPCLTIVGLYTTLVKKTEPLL